jgi:hypothetical protein
MHTVADQHKPSPLPLQQRALRRLQTAAAYSTGSNQIIFIPSLIFPYLFSTIFNQINKTNFQRFQITTFSFSLAMQLLTIVVAPLIATLAYPNRRFHLSLALPLTSSVCVSLNSMCISQFPYVYLVTCWHFDYDDLGFWVYVFNFSILHFRVLFMSFGLIFLVWFLISMVLYHLPSKCLMKC